MTNAWIDGEGPLKDERQFTNWAEPGWSAWNPYSPELEFCEVAAEIAGAVDGLVIETGAGQGYVTRRVAKVAYPYKVYESSPVMRKVIPQNKTTTFIVPDEPTPEQADIEECSLMIVDSAMQFRRQEIALWAEHAPQHSLLLMHDAGNGHQERPTAYTHKEYWRMIQDLGIPGIRYKNPRGSFLGWKEQPDKLHWLLTLLPNEYPQTD